MAELAREAVAVVTIRLRAFSEQDFGTLRSWVPTLDALAQWSAAFFAFPLDDGQLRRYLDSARQPYARDIFTAETQAGDAVGHVEVGMIWPHLSCRLSRVLVAPERRRRGIGRCMVGLALAHAFGCYRVSRVDLGVSADNSAAIACYVAEGFAPVGTWRNAIATEARTIDVYWMTLTRAAWSGRGEDASRPAP